MKTSVRLCIIAVLSVMCCLTVAAQSKTDGYVMSVEDGKVYVDLGSSQVNSGMVLNVLDGNGKSIGQIVVESTFDKYSSARPMAGLNVSALSEGMVITTRQAPAAERSNGLTAGRGNAAVASVMPTPVESGRPAVPAGNGTDNRASVIVPPAQVNDIVGVGHFGGYVADLLMEQLMMCPNVKLIDRSLFNAQIDEAEMAGSYIDPATAIERGKIAGARYAVQVTMQKPDVANVRTGVPLASIMGALQSGMNRNIGAQYMSNMEIARLKASVSLSARVIDIQTGEVLFMTSGNGKAEGDVQIGMEYGALGGAKMNDGADGFKQTVTGKAIQKAFMTVGRHLDTYFSGKATKKVMGSASGFGRFDEQLDRRGMSLYSGINKLNNDDLYSMFYDNKDLYFKYKSAKKQLRWSNFINVLGIPVLGVSAFFTFSGSYDDGDSNNFIAPVAMLAGAGMVVTGICMNRSAHRKVEDIKNTYNRTVRTRVQNMDYSLDLVASETGGLGLRFSF